MKTITSDDILGKEVVDIDGGIIGVTQQLIIDKTSKKIKGVLVDQGFMKPDIYIGINLIKNFGVDAVFLNKSPIKKLKGLEVFDKDGKKVGLVDSIEEKRNKLESIIIKKSSLSSKYHIKKNKIKTIGFSIILSEKESQLKKIKK